MHVPNLPDVPPPPPIEIERGSLLTLRQVARRLGVSERTLRGWIAAKRLAVIRLTHRTVRVEEEELVRFIRENRDGGPSPRRSGE